jgi:hypothetical protein
MPIEPGRKTSSCRPAPKWVGGAAEGVGGLALAPAGRLPRHGVLLVHMHFVVHLVGCCTSKPQSIESLYHRNLGRRIRLRGSLSHHPPPQPNPDPWSVSCKGKLVSEGRASQTPRRPQPAAARPMATEGRRGGGGEERAGRNWRMRRGLGVA